MCGSHVIFDVWTWKQPSVYPYSPLSIYQTHTESRRNAASHQNLQSPATLLLPNSPLQSSLLYYPAQISCFEHSDYFSLTNTLEFPCPFVFLQHLLGKTPSLGELNYLLFACNLTSLVQGCMVLVRSNNWAICDHISAITTHAGLSKVAVREPTRTPQP